MATIKKIVAVNFEDTSTGETGMTPLYENVHGYFDTLSDALKATDGRCDSYHEVEFTEEEWREVCAEFDAQREMPSNEEYDAWCEQLAREGARS